MKQRHFVYTLKFLDGSVYVGKSVTRSSGYEKSRLDRHRANAKNGVDLPVYDAWRKHGEPIFSIVCWCENAEDAFSKESQKILQESELCRELVLNLQMPKSGKRYVMADRTRKILSQKVWHNEEWRRSNSEKTKAQMRNGGSAYLSALFKGRLDQRSPEGKQRCEDARRSYLDSEEGRKKCAEGYAKMRENPENVRKNRESLDAWRASERNREQCKVMAKKAAEACSKKVMIVATGEVFSSQRAAAKAVGITDAAMCRWVKTGKCVRI